MKILITICLIALAQSAFAQVLSDGPCPEVGSMNFNEMQYTGMWYGIQKYNFDSNAKCISVDNISNDDGTMTFNTSGIDTITGQVLNSSINGIVTGPGKYSLQNNCESENENPLKYMVLGTDYVNWAAIDICQNVGTNQRMEAAVICGRSMQLSETDLQSARNALQTVNIDPNQLEPIDQTNC